MVRKITVALAVLLLAPVVAQAFITMSIARMSDTVATLTITGNTGGATSGIGTFENNPSARWARVSLINGAGALGSATSLWTTTAANGYWSMGAGGTNTMAATNGTTISNLLINGYSGVGPVGSDTNKKVVLPFSANPAVGWTITGSISQFTLPAGWSWGAVGASGDLYWGQANEGNSQQKTGTWTIVAGGSPNIHPVTLPNGLGGTPPDVDFGNVHYNFAPGGAGSVAIPTTQTISLINEGTAAGDVNAPVFTLGASSPFALSAGTGLTTGATSIGAGNTALYGITLNSAVATYGQTYTDTVTFTSGANSWSYTLKAVTAGPHTGDANLDGEVNLQDFSLLKAYYGQTGQEWGHGNFNGTSNDSIVNLEDFSLLKAHYNHSGDSISTPIIGVVPEPATLSLLALAGLGLLKRRK